MSVFGPRVGSYDVEQAVLTTLQERLPTYVDKCARLKGIDPEAAGFPIRPRSLITRKDFTGWPADRLPCVQVISPGMADRPVRQDGTYTAWWQVNVFVVVSARSPAATRLVRSVWEDAIGWCLMQNRGLGGLAESVDWLGESSADVPIDVDDERSLQGTAVIFTVEVPGVLDPNAGPAVFIPDPGTGSPPVYPDDPTVEEVIVDYTPEELA